MLILQTGSRNIASIRSGRIAARHGRTLAASLALLLLLVWLAQGAARAGAPGDKPDLSVAYLSLTPRYPAYEVVIAEGVPLLVDPATREPLPPTGRDAVKRRPKRGERLTATARVVNHGGMDAGPFEYSWLVNGKKVAGGRHPGLAARCVATSESASWQLGAAMFNEAVLKAGTFADFRHEVSFRGEGQRLEFRVLPAGGSDADAVEENNRREEHTDALAFVAVVRRREYNRWAGLMDPDAPPSFEDWIQQQFAALRGKFEQSAYAGAPGGIRQPVRLDLIRVLDDAAPVDTLAESHASHGWDGFVDYGPERDPAEDAGTVDWFLVRNLVRQLGIVDLANLQIAPEANGVRDTATGSPAGVGYAPPPALATEATLFSEHTVLALNRQLGMRRGFRGAYLYDVPRTCRVRVLDNNSGTVADAALTVHQAENGRIPETPVAQGVTNSNGEWPLPNVAVPTIRTAIGSTLSDNVFGKIDLNAGNGLLLVRVAARGEVEYHWLPITLFNQAYWRGQTDLATFDLRTRIPAPAGPEPPVNVAVVRNAVEPELITLNWQPSPSPKVAAYYVYRGRYPGYQWERVAALADRRLSFTEYISLLPGEKLRFRYAVTAVNLNGNESGLGRLPTEVLVD
ncbi:MAG: hypothetical protein ACO1SX_28310 [Actinomycetota bacterium]